MQITINNCPETFDAGFLTIAELLQKKNFTFKMLIVKVNGILIKKPDYETTRIADGDHVEVLHLISGG